MVLKTGGNLTANRVSQEWGQDKEVASVHQGMDSELVFINYLAYVKQLLNV